MEIRKKYNYKAITNTSLIDYPNNSIYFKLNWKKAHKFSGTLLDVYELYLRSETKEIIDWKSFKDFCLLFNKTLTDEMILKGTVFKLPQNEGIYFIYKKKMDNQKLTQYMIDWSYYNETKEIRKRTTNATEGYSCKIEFESRLDLTKRFKITWNQKMRKELMYNMLYKNSYNFYHEKFKTIKFNQNYDN